MALNLGPLNVLLQLKGAKKFDRDAEDATSSISKLGKAAKGLAAAYLSIEGAQKALDLSQEAAAFADAAAIFRHSGGNLDALRNSVRGTVSDFELVKKANLAKTMGIPAEAMGTLAEAAMAAASATGESVDFMLDSIVKGVARGSPMILDNLGIIISIEEASSSYAATLGKTAAQLTKAEQAQAVLGATLKAVGPQIQAANNAGANSAEVYARFTASIQNLTIAIGQSLSPAVSWLTSQLIQAIEFYQELFSMGDTSDSAEQAMDAIATKTKAVSVELAEAKNKYAALAQAIREGTAGEQFRLMGIEGDPERKLAQIGNQIMALETKLGKLGQQAKGVGVSSIGAMTMGPIPELPPPGAGISTAAADAAEETAKVTSRLVGVMDIGADMMLDEFNQFMESFEPDIVLDFSDAIEKTIKSQEFLAAQTRGVASDIERLGSGAVSAVRSGSVGASLVPMLGQAAGGAIGGPIGAAVGGVLGEMFGPLFDTIAQTLNVFKPLIEVVNRLAVGVFVPLVVAGAPVLQMFVEKIRDYVLPVLTLLGDGLGWVQYGMTQFQIALDNVRIWFENLWKPEDQKVAYRAFTSINDHIAAVEAAREAAMASLIGQTDETTQKFKELNEELSNVPIGVKRLRLMQYGATRGSVAFPGRFAGASAW